MCLYHTYHWTCCPGTAQPAPYYMNSKCEIASGPKKSKFKKQGKCKIVHRILDGADHDRPCPKCGQTASDFVDEPAIEDTADARDTVEQESATLKPSSTKEAIWQQEPGIAVEFDRRYEQLACAVGTLLQQQEAWAALNGKQRE